MVGLSVLALAAHAAFSEARQAEDSVSELARRIQDRVEKVQAIRERQRRLRESHADAADEATRQIERLRAQLSEANRDGAERQRELSSLEKRLADADEIVTSIRTGVAMLRDPARSTVASVEQRINGGIPRSPNRRLEALRSARTPLDGEAAEDVIHGIRAFAGWLGEEWKDAKTISLSNEPIELEGGERQRHVWMLRLGLASAAWISEDGSSGGIWSGDATNPWRVDLSSEELEDLCELFGIVRGHRPPAVVPVPCRIAPAAREGEEPR